MNQLLLHAVALVSQGEPLTKSLTMRNHSMTRLLMTISPLMSLAMFMTFISLFFDRKFVGPELFNK